MNKSFFKMFAMFFLFVFAVSLSAGTLEGRGKEWLDAQKEPAVINVSGTWDSDFGIMRLQQADGSRDVSGREGKYELTGVVSGKMLYLLFGTDHGTVDYCAVLSAESENLLNGSYHYRNTRLRFGGGLCQEKSYSMYMRKK
jgi:hypothetical protein